MNTQALQEFQLGTTACLRSWSALRTAVEAGWGGGQLECQAKAEELRRYIFQTMDGSQCPVPNLDPQDLAGMIFSLYRAELMFSARMLTAALC